MTEEFYFFWKHRLSQWHMVNFVVDGIIFNCCEQFMMCSKALLFNDLETSYKIMDSRNPYEHQQLGRRVKNFDLDKWNEHARDIVYTGNYARFTQNEDDKELLLSTGNKQIVESSPVDKIWGIGLAATDPRALNRATWRGTNWLGEVLTQVREDIKKQENLI